MKKLRVTVNQYFTPIIPMFQFSKSQVPNFNVTAHPWIGRKNERGLTKSVVLLVPSVRLHPAIKYDRFPASLVYYPCISLRLFPNADQKEKLTLKVIALAWMNSRNKRIHRPVNNNCLGKGVQGCDYERCGESHQEFDSMRDLEPADARLFRLWSNLDIRTLSPLYSPFDPNRLYLLKHSYLYNKSQYRNFPSKSCYNLMFELKHCTRVSTRIRNSLTSSSEQERVIIIMLSPRDTATSS